VSDASFRDIGTPADCLETSLALAAIEGNRLVSPSASVSPSARLTRTIVWDDVVVGANARLTDCIVADGVRLPDGTHLEHCAIVPGAGFVPRTGERVQDGMLVSPM
jgi:NDP-sugar pyrophosphorylase family protein